MQFEVIVTFYTTTIFSNFPTAGVEASSNAPHHSTFLQLFLCSLFSLSLSHYLSLLLSIPPSLSFSLFLSSSIFISVLLWRFDHITSHHITSHHQPACRETSEAKIEIEHVRKSHLVSPSILIKQSNLVDTEQTSQTSNDEVSKREEIYRPYKNTYRTAHRGMLDPLKGAPKQRQIAWQERKLELIQNLVPPSPPLLHLALRHIREADIVENHWKLSSVLESVISKLFVLLSCT